MHRSLLSRSLLLCSLLLASLSTLLAACPAAKPPPLRPVESPVLSPTRVEAHLRFLADDALQGRSIGSRGLTIAARYHESVFRKSGLEPALRDGTYRQAFLLEGSMPDSGASLEVEGGGKTLTFRRGDDFMVVSHRRDAKPVIEGELVYGGYLIQAPGRGWDDIKGKDLRGKILLVEVNEPGNRQGGIFDGEAMTYYGRWTYKFEQAGRLGAAGVLIVHERKRASYGWDVVRNSWDGEGFFINAKDQPRPPVMGWVQGAVAQKMLALVKRDHGKLLAAAETKAFTPVALGLKVRIKQRSRFRTVIAENVIGLLRAKHPEATDKVIVLMAHFDHIGEKRGGAGDRVFNGAVDNSSASATLLALAEHFGRHPEQLRTNLLFAAVSAEEEGLWGSTYLARHLPLKKERILAAINFEMTNIWGETEDVYAIGARESTLDAVCKRAAGALGLRYTAERDQEKGYFYRSDQLSFARVGVPAVWLHAGVVGKGKDKERVQRLRREFERTHYHKVTDDVKVHEKVWDLRGAVQIARWGAAIVEALAQAKTRPRFLPSSAFAPGTEKSPRSTTPQR